MIFSREEMADFPSIDDFAVVLVDTEESGQQLEYRSAARGRLAGFPAWEHVDRDLRHFIASDVPSGTREEPYEDRDEGWRIVIFEEDEWVYVAEGDAPTATTFRTKFRVPADRYHAGWMALVDEFNPVEPFDAAPPA